MTDDYARLLAARLKRLAAIGKGLRTLPLDDPHEASGLLVWQVLNACAIAYESTYQELQGVRQ